MLSVLDDKGARLVDTMILVPAQAEVSGQAGADAARCR